MPLPVSTLWPLHVHPPCDLPPKAITYSLPESNGIPLRRYCASGHLLSRSVQTPVQGVVSPWSSSRLGGVSTRQCDQHFSGSSSPPLFLFSPHKMIPKSPLLWSRMALPFSRPWGDWGLSSSYLFELARNHWEALFWCRVGRRRPWWGRAETLPSGNAASTVYWAMDRQVCTVPTVHLATVVTGHSLLHEGNCLISWMLEITGWWWGMCPPSYPLILETLTQLSWKDIKALES